jgi:hypothetical protein
LKQAFKHKFSFSCYDTEVNRQKNAGAATYISVTAPASDARGAGLQTVD